MAWLTPDIIGTLTPTGLVLLGVLMIMLGWLRPKRAVDEIRADRDARLADKDQQIIDWREAYRLSESAREKNEAALREALEVARAAETALEGFRLAAVQAAKESGAR